MKTSSFEASFPERNCGPRTGSRRSRYFRIGSCRPDFPSTPSRPLPPGCPGLRRGSSLSGSWKGGPFSSSRTPPTRATLLGRFKFSSTREPESGFSARIGNGFRPLRTGDRSRRPSFPFRTGLVHRACAKVLESSDFSIPERALLIPGTGVRARAAPFPYVGLATAVLLLHAILVAVLPPDPDRAAPSFAALFSVGYCTVPLIVGGTIRLSASEILAFSLRLTIFLPPFAPPRLS